MLCPVTLDYGTETSSANYGYRSMLVHLVENKTLHNFSFRESVKHSTLVIGVGYRQLGPYTVSPLLSRVDKQYATPAPWSIQRYRLLQQDRTFGGCSLILTIDVQRHREHDRQNNNQFCSTVKRKRFQG